MKIHAANIRPDINPGMAGLLKVQPGSQLFTVFGQPRTKVEGPNQDCEYTVTMEGVDIYNPVDNSITPTKASKVAAWFIDGDYDGRTFCITQAFFQIKALGPNSARRWMAWSIPNVSKHSAERLVAVPAGQAQGSGNQGNRSARKRSDERTSTEGAPWLTIKYQFSRSRSRSSAVPTKSLTNTGITTATR